MTVFCTIDIILGQSPRYETITIPNGILEEVGRLIITATVGAGGRKHAGRQNVIIYDEEGASSVDGGTSFVDIKGTKPLTKELNRIIQAEGGHYGTKDQGGDGYSGGGGYNCECDGGENGSGGQGGQGAGAGAGKSIGRANIKISLWLSQYSEKSSTVD